MPLRTWYEDMICHRPTLYDICLALPVRHNHLKHLFEKRSKKCSWESTLQTAEIVVLLPSALKGNATLMPKRLVM